MLYSDVEKMWGKINVSDLSMLILRYKQAFKLRYLVWRWQGQRL